MTNVSPADLAWYRNHRMEQVLGPIDYSPPAPQPTLLDMIAEAAQSTPAPAWQPSLQANPALTPRTLPATAAQAGMNLQTNLDLSLVWSTEQAQAYFGHWKFPFYVPPGDFVKAIGHARFMQERAGWNVEREYWGTVEYLARQALDKQRYGVGYQ